MEHMNAESKKFHKSGIPCMRSIQIYQMRLACSWHRAADLRVDLLGDSYLIYYYYYINLDSKSN